MNKCLNLYLSIYFSGLVIHCYMNDTNSTTGIPSYFMKGGYKVKEGEYQYIVSLRTVSDPENHIGFGTIIHPRWILTTRHHFVTIKGKDFKFIKLLVSPKYGNEPQHYFKKEKFQVESYYCLPLMEGKTEIETNLGLLKLSKPIKLGNKTKYNFQKVRMIRAGMAWEKHQYVDNLIRSVGWGSNHGFKDQLKYLRVLSSYMWPTECKPNLPTIRQPYGFCLSNSYSSLCYRDLGGPGVIRADSDIQVGVVAVGGTKCKKSDTDLYINLTHYRDWVSRVIRNGSKEPECDRSLRSKKMILI